MEFNAQHQQQQHQQQRDPQSSSMMVNTKMQRSPKQLPQQQTSMDIKMDPTKLHQQQRNKQREVRRDDGSDEERDVTPEEPKWRESIDVAQFRPQEIKVMVDPIYHTVTISAKHSSQPWPMEQRQWQKMKRVVPLPENVDVEQLRVKLLPRGELLLKAPFVQRCHDASTTPLQRKRSGAAPIAVSFKEQDQDDASVQRFLRQLKSSAFPNSLDAQCVRDETTGQWAILFDVNVVGFRPEEIRVNFEPAAEQRVLKIEARHEVRHVESAAALKLGVSVKTLRREIALPEWMDGSAMRWRVMNNGVLRIQVPCQRGLCSMKMKNEKDLEEQQPQVNKTHII